MTSANIATSEQVEKAVTASSHKQAHALEQASAGLSTLADLIKQSREQVAAASLRARDASNASADGYKAALALDSSLAALDQLANTLPDVAAQMARVEAECAHIDKLAFHSHLLALNASIESARLGERGGAFAIVADGIRSLAAESRSVAERIQQAAAEGSANIEKLRQSATQTLSQNRDAQEKCKGAFQAISDSVSNLQQSTSAVSEACDNQEEQARGLQKQLSSSAEDNGSRTSEIIGLLTGRQIEDLEPEQCRQNLDQWVVIDVRQPDEFRGELGHIRNARLVTLNDAFAQQVDNLDRDQPYLFVCRSGGRSARAARLAQGLGFQQIFNLKGGMLRWKALGLPTARAA